MKKEACFLRIVDDDEDVRESLACLFEFDGWETRTYAGAKEFLHSDALLTPGCIVLDFHMSGMSGLELLGVLSERDIRLPVILLSANNNPLLAAKAKELGAVDCLTKPVDPDVLLAAVRRAVAQTQGEPPAGA